MAQFIPPTSHDSRYILLKRAAVTGQADINTGRLYLPQTKVDDINAFLPGYKAKIAVISSTKSGRSKEVRERNEAIEPMVVTLRDLWEVVKRRANRKKEPAEVLMHYQLTLDGIIPKPTTPDGGSI